MTYKVELSPSAIQDGADAYRWMICNYPEFADKWLDGLQAAIESLSVLPGRCSSAPESEILSIDFRQLLYGSGVTIYRIIFTIDADIVQIHLIRHASRDKFTISEVE